MLTEDEIRKLADPIKVDNKVDQVIHLKTEYEGKTYEAIAIPPQPGVHARFKSMMADDRQKSQATGFLVKQCVKYPDAAGFAAMLVGKPGIVDPFAERLLEESGDLLKAESKKY